MSNKQLPSVFIVQSAADKALREVEKFYDIGMRLEGRPHEAAMVPLLYLKLREGIHKSPLEYSELFDIELIVLTHIICPPDAFKDFSAYRSRFKEGVDAHVNPIIDRYIARYPLLEACGKMHSHPFSGMGRLSSGDLAHSVFNSFNWFRAKGLNTMFSFIISPSYNRWEFNCFGLSALKSNRRLPVYYLSRNHRLAKEALSKPYYMTQEGSTWCNQAKAALRENGYNVTRATLRRGWRRYTIQINNEKIVVCIPPFFPNERIKIFRVIGQTVNEIKMPSTQEQSDLLYLVRDIEQYIVKR